MKKVSVVVGPSADGGYTASVPGLPGCSSQAESREQALDDIREALSLYLDPVKEHIELDPIEA